MVLILATCAALASRLLATCAALPCPANMSGVKLGLAHSSPVVRGLHSVTCLLNVSAFSGIGGAFRGPVGGVWGYEGVFRVYVVSEPAQDELKSGRV